MIQEKHGGEVSGRIDVRVWLRLLSCSTIIEKRLRRRFVDQYETTLPRFDVLATLERQPEGMTMSELSRALLVSNGNVTSLVRQLEGEGLVIGKPLPEDRRSLNVALTTKGRIYFSELAEQHHRWIAAMFDLMPREELWQLYELLAKLKVSLAADAEERR